MERNCKPHFPLSKQAFGHNFGKGLYSPSISFKGLRAKFLAKIRLLQAGGHKSFIVFLTETWSNHNSPDELAQIPNFSLLSRSDRRSGRGGGAALYIRENIPVKVRNDLNDENFECLWVVLRPVWLPRAISRIAVACVYFPPPISHDDLKSFYEYFFYCCDILKSESPDTSIIAAGGFNSVSNGFNPRVVHPRSSAT